MNTPRRPPPFLLGATLLFWGWQSGYTGVGAILALIIELPRWSKLRWEITQEEFTRIWVFCTLLLLAATVYAFTLNEGPSRFAEMFQDPDLRNQSKASLTSARTAAAIVRWMPMTFFLFVAAQEYSPARAVPMEIVSLILRRRWKKAKREGKPLPPRRFFDVSYIYFLLCLFSSSIHGSETGTSFFWGAGLLMVWALAPLRSPRFKFVVWAGSIALAIGVAWAGQKALGSIQQYIESLNPQWFSTFQHGRFEATRAKTALGQIGRIQASQTIVIRLETRVGPPPQYLREASFNTYRGEVWEAPGAKDFERQDEAPVNSGNYNLVPGKTNMASVQIACFLPSREGLLPLPTSCGRLTNLPVFSLERNRYGAVHANGPGLILFEADYGPGAMMDSPPSEWDVQVPEREQAALDSIIDELNLRDKSTDEVLKSISSFFGGFKYATWQFRPRSRWASQTALSRFLLSTRAGHCEYFASATVLLLHRLGIPARYAVGFNVHETSGGRKYVIRQRDAHAWCLYWDPARSAWRDFDTTPASGWHALDAPGWRRDLADAWNRVVFEFLRIRWGQTQLREYILWAVIPILIILLGQILFKRRKRAASHLVTKVSIAWPGLDSEFYQLEKRLAKKGFIRPPSEPLADWLRRSADSLPALSSEREGIREMLRLHYIHRFDPQGLLPRQRQQLKGYVEGFLSRLRNS